jgi:hypothetical protein
MFCCKPVDVHLVVNSKLIKDNERKKVKVIFYRSLVGNLLYLTITRHDATFIVSLLSKFMNFPRCFYVRAVIRMHRYIQGTI